MSSALSVVACGKPLRVYVLKKEGSHPEFGIKRAFYLVILALHVIRITLYFSSLGVLCASVVAFGSSARVYVKFY